jgi:beta-phosphoglucomutase-like phosphatase (HAD superfamily)
LDDTLVQTGLDFAAIKRDIGCPVKEDILTFISNLSCSKQQSEANRIVLEHELHDAQTSVWLPGAEAFVEVARQHALPLELKLNRNNIGIDIVITREDAPAKPDPTALLSIADCWRIATHEIAYLGDYIYDIQAAHNADMQAWLYTYQAGISDYKTCLSYIKKT